MLSNNNIGKIYTHTRTHFLKKSNQDKNTDTDTDTNKMSSNSSDNQVPGTSNEVPLQKEQQQPAAPQISLDVKFREYLESKKCLETQRPLVHVAILTPCYGSLCNCNYTLSLMASVKLLESFGVRCSVLFCPGDSLVSRARNGLIAKAFAMETGDDAQENPLPVSHFLFIDGDILWNPAEILKLLMSEKEVVGGLYPKKKYHFDRLMRPNAIENILKTREGIVWKEQIPEEQYVQHHLVDYNLNLVKPEDPSKGSNLKIENNLIEVRHLATGFMMISRDVLRKMFSYYPHFKYTDSTGFVSAKENKYCYALFDCCVQEGSYMSEDWFFCDRFLGMSEKNKIYADISIRLTHVGNTNYAGNPLSVLNIPSS